MPMIKRFGHKRISWSCENCEQKGQLPLTKADMDSLSDNIQSFNT